MAFNEHAGRKTFSEQVAAVKGGKAKPEGPKGKPSGPGPTAENDGGGTTTITHHGDGTHSIQHHDGESSGPHPTMSHAATHLAMKHDGGEAHGHIHSHDGGATTHHAGMDGEVQGPHEHGSVDEGVSHLAQAMGSDNGGIAGEHEPFGGSDYGIPAKLS